MEIDSTSKINIEKKMKEIGIAEYGFVSAEPFIGYADFVIKHHKDFATYFDIGYNKSMDEKEFYAPREHLEYAKSVIPVILPYHMDKTNKSDKNDNMYRISKATIFRDYHYLMQEKMAKLLDCIENECQGRGIAFCDTGPLNDKAVLLRTGKFKVLNNSLLWHKHYGSRFYIGYIITDLLLSNDNDSAAYKELFHPFCKTCGKCAAACPNGAINDHGHLNSKKCISFLTQSKEWEELEGLTLNGYVYGCDICQMVCPLNGVNLASEFKYQALIPERINIEDIDQLTNRQFRNIYGKSSAGWIGKKRFIRNMIENKRQYSEIK